MKVVLAGATGLVGGLALPLLREDAAVTEVVLLSRRATGLAGGKVRERIVDFDALRDDPSPERVGPCDAALCALGTTIRAAGSKEAFARVDKDYVVALARSAKAAGARTFAVVSALGADARSAVFYNRVKGEMEEAVAAVGFEAFHILRPSLLVGDRKESRPLERVGVVLAPLLRRILIGPLARSAPIDAAKVARGLAGTIHSRAHGTVAHDSLALDALSAASR